MHYIAGELPVRKTVTFDRSFLLSGSLMIVQGPQPQSSTDTSQDVDEATRRRIPLCFSFDRRDGSATIQKWNESPPTI